MNSSSQNTGTASKYADLLSLLLPFGVGLWIGLSIASKVDLPRLIASDTTTSTTIAASVRPREDSASLEIRTQLPSTQLDGALATPSAQLSHRLRAAEHQQNDAASRQTGFLSALDSSALWCLDTLYTAQDSTPVTDTITLCTYRQNGQLRARLAIGYADRLTRQVIKYVARDSIIHQIDTVRIDNTQQAPEQASIAWYDTVYEGLKLLGAAAIGFFFGNMRGK